MPFCESTCSEPSLKLRPSAPVFCFWPFCSGGANYWAAWRWFCWGVHPCTDNWTWLTKANLREASKPERRARVPCPSCVSPSAIRALPMLCNTAAGWDHAWTFLLLSWQFCVLSRRCQAAVEYSMLQGTEGIWSSLFHWDSATSPPQPTLHRIHPPRRCSLPSKNTVFCTWILVKKQMWTKEGNPNILRLSWFLGNANWIPKLW